MLLKLFQTCFPLNNQQGATPLVVKCSAHYSTCGCIEVSVTARPALMLLAHVFLGEDVACSCY